MLHFQILVYIIHVKYRKTEAKTTSLIFQDQHGMKSLNYLMDHNSVSDIYKHLYKYVIFINMKQLQITLKYKLILTNLKIELHLKLRQNIILNFYHLKL